MAESLPAKRWEALLPEVHDPPGSMPWPLRKADIDCFKQCGLVEVTFEDYMDGESAPVRRFRAEYAKMAPNAV